jgi:ribosomal protein L40E
MVRKTLGYVELEWTCPQCGSRNPGTQKICANCSAAQPAKVEFHQAAQEELITDEKEIERAKAGPDVHCAFCGARNAADAEKCSQCGADLATATARESGQVLGALQTGPAPQIACLQCGTLNDATALKCSQCNASLPRSTRPSPHKPTPRPQPSTRKAAPRQTKAAPKPASKLKQIGILSLMGIVLLVCIIGFLIVRLTNPGQEITAQVQSVLWTRSIHILEQREVTKENWRDDIPSGVSLGRCTPKRHHVQDEPAPRATEVCGTPYVVDQGTGHGAAVQDCEYHVYADWCEYKTQEWRQADVVKLSGDDLFPRWPEPVLSAQQRQGDTEETYQITFASSDKIYVYRTGDLAQFTRFQVGSQWVLKVGGLGGVKPIRPAP